MSPRPFLAPVACLAAGYLLGVAGPFTAARQAPAAKPAEEGFPMRARLGTNAFVQSAAEHRACCLQIYRLAGQRLEQLLATTPLPTNPAVVLDLDETVFDNSAFQTALYRADREYRQDLWDVYERTDPAEVRLVAGAKEFVEKAEKLGVTVVYISNRSEKFRASTVAALDRLGLSTAGHAERLLLKTDTSDKSARRAAVAARHTVVLNVGDNLRDFSEEFIAPKFPAGAGPADYRAAVADRLRKADASGRWGVDWFVIPNPVYGEWERLLGPDPREVFVPSKLDLAARP